VQHGGLHRRGSANVEGGEGKVDASCRRPLWSRPVLPRDVFCSLLNNRQNKSPEFFQNRLVTRFLPASEQLSDRICLLDEWHASSFSAALVDRFSEARFNRWSRC